MVPRFSVIIPCFNAAKFLAETLQSVQNQTCADWECLIVDDGSRDGSGTVARAFLKDTRFRFIPLGKNLGVCAARNRGFQAAHRESAYLLFLDADDCLEPATLEEMGAYMGVHPEVALTRCGYRFIDERSRPLLMEEMENKRRYVPKGWWLSTLPETEPETPFLCVFTRCGILPSIALIRRSVFEQTPGFDESFGHHHEDSDLFMHLALRGEVHYLPKVLVRKRRHPGQNTNDSAVFRRKVWEQEKKLYKKWLHLEGLSAEQRKIVRQAWRFKQGRLEPYLAFQRSAAYLREKKLGKSIRFLAGGLRRYLFSFLSESGQLR